MTLESWVERPRNIDSRFWIIPKEIYDKLDSEFHFDFDPCPYPFKRDGISIEWGRMNWVNPPFRAKDAIYGHGPTAFARKAIEQQAKGKSSVLILPVQSYVNMLVASGAEVREIGRVKWIDARTGEPYSSPSTCALFVLRGEKIG